MISKRHLNPWVTNGCLDNWMCDAFLIYAELEEGKSLDELNQELSPVLTDTDQRFKSKQLFLYPMERWNLHSEFEDGKEAATDWSDYVFGFSLLAAGILLVACINFMNLSTARSQRRAREVGIRKVSGSLRRDLIQQFLGESMLMCAVSFLLALLIVQLLLPFYNSLIGKTLSIPLASLVFWAISLVILLLTGLIAGSYPAFLLSSFSPSRVLKGKLNTIGQGVVSRRMLVIFQFGFSMLLMIGTALVYQQIQFTMDRDSGYNKDGLVSIPNNPEMQKNFRGIKQALLASGAVSSVTKSNSPITDIFAVNFLDWPGNTGSSVPITNIYADYDYLQTMGIQLIAGRDFLDSHGADTSAVLLSKAAINIMGLKNPVGANVTIAGGQATVIGITEDVLMQSPYEAVKPMYIILETDWTNQDRQYVSVRLTPSGNVHDQMEKVEAIFEKLTPPIPFNSVLPVPIMTANSNRLN